MPTSQTIIALPITSKKYTAADTLNLLHRMSEFFVSHPEYENIQEWERQKFQDIVNLMAWDLAKQT